MHVKAFLYRIICGFFLGLSIFAPGFSGSVIAIVMGIYEDILRILSNPFKKLKNNILFCIPLGIGAVISAVLFVLAFDYLFEAYPKATYLLIVGLIAGNLPVIAGSVKKHVFKKNYLIGGVFAFAVALAFCVLTMGAREATGTAEILSGVPFLMLGGFLSSAALLMPGMSFTMVLIILGVYDHLIFAANSLLRMDFTYLVPFVLFGLSVAAGLVLTSRGIKTVFDKFPGFAYTSVFGFMAGSMIGILIQSLWLTDAAFSWWLGAAMLVAGLGVSMLFVVLGKTLNKT